MKKRLLSILLIGLLIAALATGCASENSNADNDAQTDINENQDKNSENNESRKYEGQELKIWLPPFGTEDIPDQVFWDEQLKPLLEETGANISLEVVPWSDYEAKY